MFSLPGEGLDVAERLLSSAICQLRWRIGTYAFPAAQSGTAARTSSWEKISVKESEQFAKLQAWSTGAGFQERLLRALATLAPHAVPCLGDATQGPRSLVEETPPPGKSIYARSTQLAWACRDTT